jgi:hypothetical protein
MGTGANGLAPTLFDINGSLTFTPF